MALPDRKTDALANADTAPFLLTPEVLRRFHESQTANVSVDIAGASHRGMVRATNQDHFLVGHIQRSLDILDTNISADFIPRNYGETAYGMVVADGMGGTRAGDVASKLAIRTLLELVMQTPGWIMRATPGAAEEHLRRQRERFDQIQQALGDYAACYPTTESMGTTLTVVASLGLDFTVAHVGDSRAYLFRGGELLRVTRDQTLVQGLIDAGKLTPETAKRHPQRHVLTGALTAAERPVDTQLLKMHLDFGDCILVCTDGLTNMVPEPAIAEVLKTGGPARTNCKTLIQQALEAGGTDNITVAIARYSERPRT
ncbi:MAG: protein phosphatase 2C domain-containing protein [Candidatus Sumerlaeaceae bacterium]|nr:protein phosphatase 2C domain-containing protein [Candidatus Sumerlaeaceae bacterium]